MKRSRYLNILLLLLVAALIFQQSAGFHEKKDLNVINVDRGSYITSITYSSGSISLFRYNGKEDPVRMAKAVAWLSLITSLVILIRILLNLKNYYAIDLRKLIYSNGISYYNSSKYKDGAFLNI